MKKYKLNELVQATGQVQEIGEAATSPNTSPALQEAVARIEALEG